MNGLESNTKDRFADLRRQAEALLIKRGPLPEISTDELRRTVHELNTYQIELELQNEELRQTQAELQESRNRFIDLYDFAPVGYLTLSDKGLILEANLKASMMLATERPRLRNAPLSQFISKKDQDTYYLCRRTLSGSHQPQSCELKMSGQNDNPFYARMIMQWVSGCDINDDRILIVLTDITERVLMEAERSKLLTALDQTEEIIMISDTDANIQYVNNAFEAVTGYSYEEVKEKNPRMLQSGEHDENFYAEMWRTLKKGQTWKGQLKNKKKDGTLYTEEATISPVRDSAGQIVNYVAAKRDITEQIQKEQQFRQKNKMEAIGYMAGGMAHNFNNNLAIILGNIELSQMKQSPGSEAIPLLENARIAVKRSRDLIKKIITYSRQGSQNKVSTQLTKIIDETMSLISSTLPSTINLQTHYNPECHRNSILADPSQIQEVLINLFNNAVHAMDETGDLSISLEPVTLENGHLSAQYNCSPGRYSKISIKDSGCGIPVEIRDNIFDPFFSTKEAFEGAGMGLATVQGIVAQHDGMIKVDSALNQGTTIELYFPLSEELQKEEDPTPQNHSLPRGTERILYVDDDEMQTQVAEQMLKTMGYRVEIMHDSQKALTLFADDSEKFDLVITDQTMPNLSGVNLIRALKDIRPDIPAILCTGFSNKIDEETAESQGVSTFLMKPIDFPQLLQTIRLVLDKSGL